MASLSPVTMSSRDLENFSSVSGSSSVTLRAEDKELDTGAAVTTSTAEDDELDTGAAVTTSDVEDDELDTEAAVTTSDTEDDELDAGGAVTTSTLVGLEPTEADSMYEPEKEPHSELESFESDSDLGILQLLQEDS